MYLQSFSFSHTSFKTLPEMSIKKTFMMQVLHLPNSQFEFDMTKLECCAVFGIAYAQLIQIIFSI